MTENNKNNSSSITKNTSKNQFIPILQIINEMDYAYACDSDSLMMDCIADIKPLCEQAQCNDLINYIQILEKLLIEGTAQIGHLRYQTRVENILSTIRSIAFSQLQLIERNS